MFQDEILSELLNLMLVLELFYHFILISIWKPVSVIQPPQKKYLIQVLPSLEEYKYCLLALQFFLYCLTKEQWVSFGL